MALGPLAGPGCRRPETRPPPPRRWLTAAPRGARATRAEQRSIARRKREAGVWAMASPRRARRWRRRLVFRHPLRRPRRPARRRCRRWHQASRRRRRHRRLLRRLLRFQPPARGSRRCATSALVLGVPSNPFDPRRIPARCHTRPRATGCVRGLARAWPTQANSFPTSNGPSGPDLWPPARRARGARCGVDAATGLPRGRPTSSPSSTTTTATTYSSFVFAPRRRARGRRFRELPLMRCGLLAALVAAAEIRMRPTPD